MTGLAACRSEPPAGVDVFRGRRAVTAALFLLLVAPVRADLDTAIREALADTYYELEVASYCGLVSEAVALPERAPLTLPNALRGPAVDGNWSCRCLANAAHPGPTSATELDPSRRLTLAIACGQMP